MKKTVARDATGHIIPAESRSYNDRLFTRGFRGFLHGARFRWLHNTMKQLHITDGTVLELGCFDGKTIGYLPFAPAAYHGYDADWEDGLTIAADKWKSFPAYTFSKSDSLQAFNPGNNRFDYVVAMETMEHLPLNELDNYLQKLQLATGKYFFVTVPVEKGFVATCKYLAKALFLKVDEPYTGRELWHMLTGNLSKVKRVELGHKGFDYSDFIKKLSTHFEIVRVQGIPLTFIPPVCNFSVAIIARPLNNLSSMPAHIA